MMNPQPNKNWWFGKDGKPFNVKREQLKSKIGWKIDKIVEKKFNHKTAYKLYRDVVVEDILKMIEKEIEK